MALLDKLQQELELVVDRRLELLAKPKPDYSIDGKSYSWAQYLKILTDQQEAIEAAIQRASGPFMLITRWRP